ncbi:hypothetical protein BZL29_8430 [Mycobacterium kansasii]|uniref:Uncharacterized protein n=1 Tax=Mycobacterium kansasii TaxID=1768 RepID=A0A1V3WA03_MYCKA|nr:hypothetical protein BZL29_8430 [Mycobacterium kansasii]
MLEETGLAVTVERLTGVYKNLTHGISRWYTAVGQWEVNLTPPRKRVNPLDDKGRSSICDDACIRRARFGCIRGSAAVAGA